VCFADQRGVVACALAGGGVPPSAPIAAVVIQRTALPAGQQISEPCLRRADGSGSRLRQPCPPPSRKWNARRLTFAPRGTPPPAQSPCMWSGLTSSEASMPDVRAKRPDPAARWPGAYERASTRHGTPTVVRGTARSAAQAAGVTIRRVRRAEPTIGRKARRASARRPRSKSCGPARGAARQRPPATESRGVAVPRSAVGAQVATLHVTIRSTSEPSPRAARRVRERERR
jgi:hypothetical protein